MPDLRKMSDMVPDQLVFATEPGFWALGTSADLWLMKETEKLASHFFGPPHLGPVVAGHDLHFFCGLACWHARKEHTVHFEPDFAGAGLHPGFSDRRQFQIRILHWCADQPALVVATSPARRRDGGDDPEGMPHCVFAFLPTTGRTLLLCTDTLWPADALAAGSMGAAVFQHGLKLFDAAFQPMSTKTHIPGDIQMDHVLWFDDGRQLLLIDATGKAYHLPNPQLPSFDKLRMTEQPTTHNPQLTTTIPHYQTAQPAVLSNQGELFTGGPDGVLYRYHLHRADPQVLPSVTLDGSITALALRETDGCLAIGLDREKNGGTFWKKV